MDTSWLPHWTTAVALGCGLGGLYVIKPDPRAGENWSAQEKFLLGMVMLYSGALFLLPLLVVGAVFLVVGWSRSAWWWNVAGAALPLWIIHRIWRRLVGDGGPPQTAASEERKDPVRNSESDLPAKRDE